MRRAGSARQKLTGGNGGKTGVGDLWNIREEPLGGKRDADRARVAGKVCTARSQQPSLCSM